MEEKKLVYETPEVDIVIKRGPDMGDEKSGMGSCG